MRMSGGRRLIARIRYGRSRGATLVEAVIATLVLGMLLASIPAAIVVSINAQHRQYETRVAESLTRSQFEYIKAWSYAAYTDWGEPDANGNYAPYGMPLPRFENYSVGYAPMPVDLLGNDLGEGELDSGVQKITVSVYRDDPNGTKPLLETTNYKVDRSLEISGYEIPIPTQGP